MLIEENKSFGHAFGLIALACEEIAKVNMVYLSINRVQIGKKDPLRNHFEKQQNLATLTFARYIPLYILAEIFDKEIGEKPKFDKDALMKIFDKTLQEFYEKIKSDPELRNRMLQRQYFFGRLEINENGEEIYKAGVLSELREYSLYVDIFDDNTFLTPKKIPEDNTLSLRKIAEEDLYYTDLLYNEGRIIKKYNIMKPTLPLIN